MTEKENNNGKTKGKNPHKGTANLKPCKPGQTNNPNGRPKGVKNRSTILRELLELIVLDANGKPQANPLNPEDKKINYEQMVGIALVKKAAEGDIRAIQEIQDTLHGKIKSETHLTGTMNSINHDATGMTQKQALDLYSQIKDGDVKFDRKEDEGDEQDGQA